MLVVGGMGGHNGGSEAIQMVVGTFCQLVTKLINSVEALFEQGQAQGNQMIAVYIDKYPDLEGMGSTVVAALLVNHQLYWLSVSDSPLWLLRNGQL